MELNQIVSILTSHIECPVCLETLTTPKLLPCGHRFCEKCLLKIQHKDRERDYTIRCPVCKQKTKTSAILLPTDGLAAKLKHEIDEFVMLNDFELCAVCFEEEAKARCFNCQASLCERCHNKHSTIRDYVGHTVVKLDRSLSCSIHKKDLAFVCEECHKAICSCCLMQGCYGHKHTAVGDDLEKYFEIRESTESDSRFIRENFKTLEQRLQGDFNRVTGEIQKHSDNVVSAVKKETEDVIRYLRRIESDAKSILHVTKTAADRLRGFRDVKREDCRHELPAELLKNLPTILRSEVQASKDSYVLDEIVFNPNKNISIGSVRVSLSKPESNTSSNMRPRLYGSQLVSAKQDTHQEIIGDLRKLSFTLYPGGKGRYDKSILEMFPDDALLCLRYLFAEDDW